jgi:hypothetical protein
MTILQCTKKDELKKNYRISQEDNRTLGSSFKNKYLPISVVQHGQNSHKSWCFRQRILSQKTTPSI